MKKWSGSDPVEYDMFGNPTVGVPERLHQKWMDSVQFRLFEPGDEALVTQFVDEAIAKGICAIDTEGTGIDTRIYDGVSNDNPVGLCLAHDPAVGFYLPFGHTDPKGNLPRDFVIKELKRLAENCILVFWQSKYDTEMIRTLGVDISDSEKFEDAQIGWFLCDSDSHKYKLSLKAVSESFLGKKMIDLEDLFSKEEKSKNFALLSPEEGFIYAASDAMMTLENWQKIAENKVFKMQGFVYKVEKKLIPAVCWMERNQFKIDVDYLKSLEKECLEKQNEAKLKLFKLAGQEFNISSPDQLGTILAEKFGIPLNKTATGKYATSKDEIEELEKQHGDKFTGLNLVLEHRKYEKVIGTYIYPLLENRDHLDQAKFNFKPLGADTGRFASSSSKIVGKDGKLTDSGVNGQNIPSVEKSIVNIRKAFIARPGFVLAAIDYSGVELRIAANLSGCKAWIEEFLHGTGDLHTLTARDAYKIPKDRDVDSKLRKTAKAINFGLLYGGGANTIAETAGIPKEEGYRLMKNFFSGVPELERWLKKMKQQAKSKGYVQDAFGRTFLLPDAKSEDRRISSAAERKSVNSPIQGSSATITKMAMVKAFRLVKEHNWWDDCRMLMTVHDELVFEVRESKMVEILTILISAMKSCTNPTWPVPLDVDCEWSYNWGEVQTYGPLGHEYEKIRKKAEKARQPIPEKPKALLELMKKLAPMFAKEPPKTPQAKPPKEPKPAAEEPASVGTNDAPDEPPEEEPADVAEEHAPAVPAPAVPAPAVSEEPEEAEESSVNEPVQQEQPAAVQSEDVPIVKFMIAQPLNRWKWRRLEAAFLLSAGDIYNSGNCKLQLVDERDRNILGSRVVIVNKQAFYFEAVRQGLVSSAA